MIPKPFVTNDASIIKKHLKLNKNIAVLGCGWLGIPLAKKLIALDMLFMKYSNPSKLVTLKSEGIVPFLIKLNETQTEGDIQAFWKLSRTYN